MSTLKTAASTVDSFRNLHDRSVIVPRKIKTALEAMLKEHRESWKYEGDFIKFASISATEWPQYREKFKAHVIETPPANGKGVRNVVFADAKVAASVRKSIAKE
jgi:hypothetical protein